MEAPSRRDDGRRRDEARDEDLDGKRHREGESVVDTMVEQRAGEAGAASVEERGSAEVNVRLVEEEARELERNELEEAMKYLAGPGRAGVAAMVSVGGLMRGEAESRRLFASLAKLPLSERCELVLKACEEEGKNIRCSYILTGKKFRTIAECCILSSDSSPDSIIRVLESQFGGWLVLVELARRTERTLVEVADRAGALDRCFELLAKEWSLLSGVQEDAFKSSSPVTLEWLISTGLYDADRNSSYAILWCENELGLRKLVEEGRDPNGEAEWGNGDLEQPLTASDRSARMVDALLSVGAKIELLTGRAVPSPAALRRMLQLQSAVTRKKFPGEVILRNLGRHERALYHVQVMREFDYPTPVITGAYDRFGVREASFTFQYIRERPPLRPRKDGTMRFLWRPHTHYACSIALHAAVKTTLLCLKRMCNQLPKDIRNLLLETAFGDVAFEGARGRS